FLGSAPFLDFLFTRDGRAGARMWLEPDELGDVVLFCEAGKEFFFVLANAVRKIAGYAEVEDARFAGHEVDVEGALHSRNCDTGTRGLQMRSAGEERFLSAQADAFARANA